MNRAGTALLAAGLVLTAGLLLITMFNVFPTDQHVYSVQMVTGPTPTPHPDVPDNSYRATGFIPEANDTIDGQVGSSPNPAFLAGDRITGGYGWITSGMFTTRHPATDHTITYPACTGKGRFLIVTPLPVGDLEYGGGFNQQATIVQIGAYTDAEQDYLVYATRDYLLCSVMSGLDIIVRP